LERGENGQIGLGDLCQQFRVGDDLSQVDVDGRLQSGFQGEAAKLNTARFQQPIGEDCHLVIRDSDVVRHGLTFLVSSHVSL
jgi:hypothetical protein